MTPTVMNSGQLRQIESPGTGSRPGLHADTAPPHADSRRRRPALAPVWGGHPYGVADWPTGGGGAGPVRAWASCQVDRFSAQLGHRPLISATGLL